MSNKGLLLMTMLPLFGLQCARDQTPVSTDQAHARSESSAATDVVRLPDAVCDAVGIQVEKVKSRECKSVLKAMGKVLAPQPQTAIVSYPFAGMVAEIHVGVGDWVEEGQHLITLESQDVGDAKSEFYKATAHAELARLNFQREERLLEDGIGIKKNFVAAEAEHKVAQASLEAAHKRLHILGFTDEQVEEIADSHQINPTIILDAPIAGKVVDIKPVRGAMVDPSTEIMLVIDLRSLWVDAGVYEKDIAKVRAGQEVEIAVPAYPGETFNGKISYIGDVVDDETRTITVRADVSNEQFRLKPGMFADVDVVLNGGARMLVVPSAAVLEEGDQKIVFVKQDDSFVRREIQAGAVEGDHQRVLGGLEAGEEVVIEGNHELKSKLQEGILKAAEVH